MNLFFDFDGVILNSLDVKEIGFRQIFSKYDNHYVDKLIVYHKKNLGKSRFIKIKYFYNKILKKEISPKLVNIYGNRFSTIMKKNLNNKTRLINDAMSFIKNNYMKNNLFIVSGTEDLELKWLCKSLGIKKYFNEICGSPELKDVLVKNIINKYALLKSNTVLIGDSINDYDAARQNKIFFYGYNNSQLDQKKYNYISRLKKIIIS